MSHPRRQSLWVGTVIALLVIVSGPAPAAETRPEEFTMVVGEELAFQGMQEYAVENQQILSAVVAKDNRGVVVKALRPGSSRVLFRLDAGGRQTRVVEIVVGIRDPKFVVSELEVLLHPYPDVKLRVNRMQVIAEGTVKNEAELRSVRELLRRYDGQVTELVTLGTAAPQRVVMIRLDLHFVAVLRRFSSHIGVRYPASISGGQVLGVVSDALTFGSAIIGQSTVLPSLLPTLDFVESNGYIRIKRVDTLVTENGTKAVYREGSELPVRLTAAIGSGTLQMIFYGAELTLTPRLSANNDMVALDINADISQKDNAVTQDGIPGKTISMIHSSVQIPIGRSMLLSAVDLQTSGKTRTGLPVLSRVPVLGYLFGSEMKDSETVYGAVYITPTLIEKPTAAGEQQINRALEYFNAPFTLPISREGL